MKEKFGKVQNDLKDLKETQPEEEEGQQNPDKRGRIKERTQGKRYRQQGIQQALRKDAGDHRERITEEELPMED